MSDTSMLAFPKPKDIKKRKHHPKSIMQAKDGTCYLCGILHDDWRTHTRLEEHHVFSGYRRQISEEEGLKVYLCPMQEHSHSEWMSLIGRNYL